MGIVELGEKDLGVELVVEFRPGGEAVSSLGFSESLPQRPV